MTVLPAWMSRFDNRVVIMKRLPDGPDFGTRRDTGKNEEDYGALHVRNSKMDSSHAAANMSPLTQAIQDRRRCEGNPPTYVPLNG